MGDQGPEAVIRFAGDCNSVEYSVVCRRLERWLGYSRRKVRLPTSDYQYFVDRSAVADGRPESEIRTILSRKLTVPLALFRMACLVRVPFFRRNGIRPISIPRFRLCGALSAKLQVAGSPIKVSAT